MQSIGKSKPHPPTTTSHDPPTHLGQLQLNTIGYIGAPMRQHAAALVKCPVAHVQANMLQLMKHFLGAEECSEFRWNFTIYW